MNNTDILEDLDEFDARYLESYHQVTSKVGQLDWPCINQLSSPLLSPESELEVSTLESNAFPDVSVPRAPVKFENAVSFTAMLLVTASPTYLTLDSDNYHPVDLRNQSPHAQFHKLLFPSSPYHQYFDHSLGDDMLFTPLDQTWMASCSSLGDDESTNKKSTLPTFTRPLRMNRLLLTLMLTAKLKVRRSKDRRSTVTTYVGNPFYRRRHLQAAKSYGDTDAA